MSRTDDNDTDGDLDPEEPGGPGRNPPIEADLERVVERISLDHSLDVRGYRRSTLYRRLRKRMADAGAVQVEDYLVRLETDRQEYPRLIDTILINVTKLFRDPDAWTYLQRECLQPLLQRKARGEPIRIWSAGCATGEEAYTLAMCAAELVGEERLRDIKIYATDVDEAALATARIGSYGEAAVQHVQPERLRRFFMETPRGDFQIRRELRSLVIFGRHNVLRDPPISRLDLLCCRNVLIYFDTETQQQLLSRFHYALQRDGFLFLGKAETLMSRSTQFRVLEPRFRLFQRHGTAAPAPARPVTVDAWRATPPRREPTQITQAHVLQSFFSIAVAPLILLDVNGRIVLVSARAREIFQISELLVGRNFLELEERLRPLTLRLAIEEVRATERPVHLENVQIPSLSGEVRHLNVDVLPLLDPWGGMGRILLWGHDVAQEQRLAAELSRVREDLEAANEELQCTNEELETANEELQCTNEELETTNEELQSTNEELETTVEELQSTNEELETTNDELRSRQDDLDALAAYNQSVLSSLGMGLIVLNNTLAVTGWNRTSEETWGLRESEVVGQDLLSLDSGLPVVELRDALSRLQQGARQPQRLVVDATNRRGRRVRCRIRVSPLQDSSVEVAGAIILIEDQQEVPGGDAGP